MRLLSVEHGAGHGRRVSVSTDAGRVRRLPSERSLRIAAAVIALGGIGVATYIAIADATSGSPVCLAGGHGCETVAHSRYSQLLGANVAVIGIAGYVLLLGSALLAGDAGRFGAFLLSAVGFGFSVYLTYLELFVIDAVCQWCVASAVLMTVLFALNATRVFGYGGSDLPSGHEGTVSTASGSDG